MCQKYVDRALREMRDPSPNIYGTQSTDDILGAHQDKAHLHDVLHELMETLSGPGLKVAPGKIQMDPPSSSLGRVMQNQTVPWQPLPWKTEHVCAFNDVQNLWGDIHWIRPLLKRSTRGAWVAQSVKPPASARVRSHVRGFEPRVRLCAAS